MTESRKKWLDCLPLGFTLKLAKAASGKKEGSINLPHPSLGVQLQEAVLRMAETRFRLGWNWDASRKPFPELNNFAEGGKRAGIYSRPRVAQRVL